MKLAKYPIVTNTLLIIGIALTILVLFFTFSKIDYKATESKIKIPQTSKFTPKEIPELAEILGPDQETRLKAGRKLVERVGVEDALEILEHSDLPHTGEGHLVVHQIGFFAYQKYGKEGILKCKDYFLFACYHGVIIEEAGEKGVEAIVQMTDTCKDSGVRFFQCVHAAGHAILAMLDYKLDEALKTCDQLYEQEKQF